MRIGKRAIELEPEEFEELVRDFIRLIGAELEAFDVEHRETVETSDGSYEIDVTARFHALACHFVVLIECKKLKRPVEREVIQVLNDRLRALGAHKGIVFSTGGFQAGAIHYAKQHGIALVAVAPGRMIYEVADLKSSSNVVAFRAGPISLWHCTVDDDGQESDSAILCGDDARNALQLEDRTAT